jgi:hypothetical protein
MDPPPKIHVRWFQVGVPELLSVVPITLNPNAAWKALTRTESDACEEAWLKLTSNSPSPVSPPKYLDEGNSADEDISPEDGIIPLYCLFLIFSSFPCYLRL